MAEGCCSMNDDPFRLNAKPQEKKEDKMYEFFEGIRKNTEAIKELGMIVGWVVIVGMFLSACVFGIHSCTSEEMIRSISMDLTIVCVEQLRQHSEREVDNAFLRR